MRWRRVAAWTGLALCLMAAPAAGMAGMAAWQEFAPGSLRQVILTAAALTEPKGIDRILERLEIAVDTESGSPG